MENQEQVYIFYVTKSDNFYKVSFSEWRIS